MALRDHYKGNNGQCFQVKDGDYIAYVHTLRGLQIRVYKTRERARKAVA